VTRLVCALVVVAGCGSRAPTASKPGTDTGKGMTPGTTAPDMGTAMNPTPPDPPSPPIAPPGPNAITQENALPGDADWPLKPPATNHAVEGYGSRITLHAGDSLDVMVNAASAAAVSWKAYRIGWYGGAGARVLSSGGPINVVPQATCPRNPTTSRIECSWQKSFTLMTGSDWLSGAYVIKLHASGGESYVPFVIVDGRQANIVQNVNVTSWQAYNDFGGESLYVDGSGTMPHLKAWEVSFDRPFKNDHGAGRLFDYEADLIRYVEALGYDVSYTTPIDMAHDGSQVKAAHLFISVANDEYWLQAEKDAVQTARDAGVSLAFLGADQVLWRVRLQASTAGVSDRVIAGYKDDQDKDPVLAMQGPTATTARFRDPPLANPENALSGVGYDSWLLVRQPMVVSDAASFVFANTGLSAGDSLPAAIAAEYDTRLGNGAEPAGLKTLAASPVLSAHGQPRTAMMTYYKAPSGAEVVAVGSIGFVNGLGAGQYADPRVAKMTRNILDRFNRQAGAPDPAGAPWTKMAATPTIDGAWATSVSTVAGGPQTTLFSAPGGVAVGKDGTIYVADTGGNQIRAVSPDGKSVTTFAGMSIDGYANGPGASARFRWPIGLAIGSDGTLYVADSVNNVIRAIGPDAAHTVSTYAGTGSPAAGLVNGPGNAALFDTPVAVAVAPDGGVLVADLYNSCVRRIDPGPQHTVTTFVGTSAPGFSDGPAATAQMNSPSGVTVAPDGTVYVLDTYNQAIRRVATDGAHTVTTLIGGDGYPSALVDGPGPTARLGAQNGLAWLGGKLYVSDVASTRIRVITPGSDAAATTVATFAGSGRSALSDGDGQSAAIGLPAGLAAAPDGRLFLVDAGSLAVRALVTP
jgi:sugar lactone lactonase YvrE